MSIQRLSIKLMLAPSAKLRYHKYYMKHNQHGGINILLVPLILAVVLLIAAASFGAYAFNNGQMYKNNDQQLIEAALAKQKQSITNQLNASFAQAQKTPYQTYNGPQAYGSIVLQYPKTWSAYIDDTGTGSALLDGYFDPGYVPALSSQTSTFSLRVQVLSASYSNSVQSYASSVTSGAVTVTPFSLVKVPSVIGVKVVGTLSDGSTGTMVILPVRSQTIEIWTESTQFTNDFNSIILPNFSFSP
jgi:hypothetical protein